MTLRVLCLGNTLIADDAFGPAVARRLRQEQPSLDVAESSAAGFDLLDEVLGASTLVVVDIFKSGTLPPGRISVLREGDFEAAAGSSPHYVGLFEALSLGRALRLPVPADVTIIAVEPADCLTIGGAIHPAVLRAIPSVLDLIRNMASADPVSCPGPLFSPGSVARRCRPAWIQGT